MKTNSFHSTIKKADCVMLAPGRSVPRTWGERYADQPYYVFKNVCKVDIFKDIFLVYDDFLEKSESNAPNHGIIVTESQFLNPKIAHYTPFFQLDEARKIKSAIVDLKKLTKNQ